MKTIALLLLAFPTLSYSALTLAGHWTFDTPAGTNSVAGGNVVSYNNGAVLNNTVIAGNLGGQSLMITNTTSTPPQQEGRVASYAAIESGDNILVSYWMRNNATANSSGFARNISKALGGIGWETQRNNGGADMAVRVDTSALNNQTGTSEAGLYDNNWHLVTFSLNNGSRVIYRDGANPVSSGYSQGAGFGSTQPLLLGFANNDIGQTYNGYLDDTAIWNGTDAITPAKVAALYTMGTSSFGYNAASVNQLFLLHDTAAGSANINGLTWRYSGALAPGTPGSLVTVNGQPTLYFTAITGVLAPEPSRFLLVGLAFAAMLARRSRR